MELESCLEEELAESLVLEAFPVLVVCQGPEVFRGLEVCLGLVVCLELVVYQVLEVCQEQVFLKLEYSPGASHQSMVCQA